MANPTVIAGGPQMGVWPGTVTTPQQRPWLQPGANPQYGGAAQNIRNTIAFGGDVLTAQKNAYPTLAAGAAPNAVATSSFHDFLDRIWLFPQELSLRNPTIGSKHQFKVWNTATEQYLNTFVSSLLQDLTGIETDLVPGAEYISLEQRTHNLWLTDEAGFKMNGLLRLVFSYGEGQMRVIVERASIVPVVPDAPVTERWTWRSQVMVSENGSEQRVSLSPSPRRETDFNLTVIYPDEANAVIKQLFGDSASAIVMPQYQYLTGIKTAVSAGATVVIADPTYGDLRPGMDILFYMRNIGTSLNTIKSVTGETIELETPLDTEMRAGTWIMPVAGTYLNRRTDFERAAADGYATLNTVATDTAPADPFVYEPRRVALTQFNGLPILDKRPLVVSGSVGAVYDSGVERLDYGNKITLIAPWSHTQIELDREYYVDRFFAPEELAMWRSLFDYCRGRVKPFYVPTFRPDLKLAEPPGVGAGSLVIEDTRYSSVFFGRTIADQLAIYTAAGVHYTTVLGATPNELNQDVISLGTPLPGTPGWDEIQKISFVLRCRLASDTVELEHHSLHSFLRFSIRTTDQ